MCWGGSRCIPELCISQVLPWIGLSEELSVYLPILLSSLPFCSQLSGMKGTHLPFRKLSASPAAQVQAVTRMPYGPQNWRPGVQHTMASLAFYPNFRDPHLLPQDRVQLDLRGGASEGTDHASSPSTNIC